MGKPLLIGNAQGFWGDLPDAAARLVERQPDLDFLTLDYLAEVSLSIMAIQKEKNPAGGFAADFIDTIGSLLPAWQAGAPVRIISNAGGLNPAGCAAACVEVLKSAGLRKKVAVVTGDDVLARLGTEPGSRLFANLETGEPLDAIRDRLVTANVYLGATTAAEAVRAGADVVITGRLADPSLTVAACLAEFTWALDDFDRLAAATVGGHLIECGTQVTGGISTNWLEIQDPADMGFPVLSVCADGRLIISKAPGTGGQVTEETVKEQLLYEISDPGCYLTPDVTVSFLELNVERVGDNEVQVTGARGVEPPSTLKVSATYRDGYKAEGMLSIVGPDAVERARRSGRVILERMRQAGLEPARSSVEALGSGDVVPGVLPRRDDLLECVLRIAVADPRKECLEFFSRQLAPLVTSGPSGVTGYSTGRPAIRPVFGFWPCLIERTDIDPRYEMMET